MCGIVSRILLTILTPESECANCFLNRQQFAYANYLVEKDRQFVVDTLLNGLARMEYRGKFFLILPRYNTFYME